MEEIKGLNGIQVEILAIIKKKYAVELQIMKDEDFLYPDRDAGDPQINALLTLFVKEGLLK